MARRRSRRRKRSYEAGDESGSEGAQPLLIMEELSPRARRLVEGGVIDLDVIAGSGPGGQITSGDILHAARIMEVQQSVARIETVHGQADVADDVANPVSSPTESLLAPEHGALPGDQPEPASVDDDPTEEESSSDEIDEPVSAVSSDADTGDAPDETDHTGSQPEEPAEEQVGGAKNLAESATFTAVNVGGEPVTTEPNPWEEYHGSSEGFSERARVGAEQSWGEAEALLAAMAEEAAAEGPTTPEFPPFAAGSMPEGEPTSPVVGDLREPPIGAEDLPAMEVAATSHEESIQYEPETEPAPADTPAMAAADSASGREVMMDFGTLELIDPESVWAEGAEDFAPWFLAHSRQLGDVLGLESGLSNARQFTTKSASGVLGTDDQGDDVVVVSSENAAADDSDLGRALGMAASSGAASVALVSAVLGEDQLKALAWLNNQTKSGVKWYGIEMRVVRIADSPAAMLFDLVASPPEQ